MENMKKGVVLISGGSRGLGLQVAEFCLHQLKHPVATFARRATPEVRALEKSFPDSFLFREIDVSDTNAVQAFVTTCASTFGSFHALINNAAVGQDHLLTHLPPETLRQIIDINLLAPIMLTKIVLKHMILGNPPAHIVNISSICGSRGFPGLSAYSATKGGMDAFTRSLAREVGARGIFVNSIAPGFFESEMSSLLSEEQIGAIVRRTPTGRLVKPEDILPLVKFLLCENTNMTGQTLYIDGGAIS